MFTYYDVEHEMRMDKLRTKQLEAHARKIKLEKLLSKHSHKTPDEIRDLCSIIEKCKRDGAKAKDDMIHCLASM